MDSNRDKQTHGNAEALKEKGKAMAEDARDKGKNLADSAKDAAKGVVDDAKHAAKDTGAYVGEQLRETRDEVGERAKASLDEGRGRMSESVEGVASAFARAGDELRKSDHPNLAHYSEMMGERVGGVANYLGERDLGGIWDDVEAFARRRPWVFVGAAVGLGVLAARFLKSSRPNEVE